MKKLINLFVYIQIYLNLKIAKNRYIKYLCKGKFVGLCHVIDNWDMIPEYNRKHFDKTIKYSDPNAYWWPKRDIYSRINALSRLIELYKQKIIHFYNEKAINKLIDDFIGIDDNGIDIVE